MDTLRQDLRYALRTLLRSPGFTLAAVLTLALGIGANTMLFSLANAVWLRPPAHVAAPERLVALYTSDYSGPAYGSSSYPDYLDFRRETAVFSGVAAYAPRVAAVGEGAEPERTGVELVSENFFAVLGVRPALGRGFTAEEGRPGGPAVAVISHDLWRRHFGGAADVVGRQVRLNARPFTVVGVAPEGFHGALRGPAFDAWVPLGAAEGLGMGLDQLEERGGRSLFLLARLAPGVSAEEAQARMGVVARRLLAEHPGQWRDVSEAGRRITLLPEAEARVPPQGREMAVGFFALLMGTVGVVLLVCCANVAGLLLARATARAREVGVRLALGATRRRLVGQMLSEAGVLALAGAALGSLAALWATDLLLAVRTPLPMRVALDFRPDGRVLAFTAGVTVLAVALFGLAPSLRASRADVARTLSGETGSVAGAGRRRLPLRDLLVVAQVAMSLLLLAGAGLFLRALAGAAAIDPGFRAEGVLLVSVEPRPGAGREEERARVMAALGERVAALPGVEEVSWAASVPLGPTASRRGVSVPGYQPGRGEDMEFHFNVVGPRYFETMRAPLARGRGITAEDREGAPRVVVVNETFARRFWPGKDPLGQRLSVSGAGGPWLEVVGVARDGKYLSLAEDPLPYLYFAAAQEPWGATLHVRTGSEPLALVPAVREALREDAPGWMLQDPTTLEETLAGSLLPQRVAAGVFALFGALAVLLAAVGLYGVVAYAVARRTREIGVRVALGARAADVVRLVLRRGAGLALAGIAVGLPAAWALSRLLSGLLVGGGPGDLLPFAGSAALLAAVALLASWLPARRAARIEPMRALRTE